MLTVEEAARRACVSEDLIHQWIADGTLSCSRMEGKQDMIAVEDLDGVLAAFTLGMSSKPRREIERQVMP